MITRWNAPWEPDAPDFRDFTVGSDAALDLNRYLGDLAEPLPDYDFRDDFIFPWDADGGACAVAHACCSALECMRANCEGRLEPLSRTFVADSSRMLSGVARDANVSIRAALRGIRRAGIPPQCVAKHLEAMGGRAVDSPLCYTYAEEYSDLRYVRIPSEDRSAMLSHLRRLIHAHIPCVLGLSLPSTFPWTPTLELRKGFDRIEGRGAVVLCGYQDAVRPGAAGIFTFLGPFPRDWGSGGFGEMHYSYVLDGMLSDAWVAYKPVWLERLARDRWTTSLA